MSYPVNLQIERPDYEVDRGQLAWKVAILIALHFFLDISNFWLWVAVPIIASILIAQKGGERYIDEADRGPTRWIRVLLAFWAYAAFLTNKLPFEDMDDIDLDIAAGGTPTVGETLLRIILAIPHGIALFFLGLIGFLVWIGTIISLLSNGKYPEWAYNYFRGYLRWQARVLAYMASLVEEYPPFSFDDVEDVLSAPGGDTNA